MEILGWTVIVTVQQNMSKSKMFKVSKKRHIADIGGVHGPLKEEYEGV